MTKRKPHYMHMPEFTIHWDGDLWVVEMDGEHLDAFTHLGEACEAIKQAFAEKRL